MADVPRRRLFGRRQPETPTAAPTPEPSPPAPPKRPAGPRGLIAALSTRARLEQEDEDATKVARAEAKKAAATPAPSPSIPAIPLVLCHPRNITALRLDISGSTVTVPAPKTPAYAACTTSQRSFGINPVVATNPVTK